MKIRVVVILSSEDLEILKNGDVADFDDPCSLLSELQDSIKSGEYEVVE